MSNTLSSKFNAIEGELNLSLFERREMIHGLTLSILSDTNMLLLGSPGTGKSMLVTEWSKHITDAKYFAWMLSKFSTPEELFGPFSINALENDRYLRVTAGKLPDAHFGFIDEIFKAGAAILNSMLTVLNERIFYNDGVPVKTPLISIIGASNEIPEEDDGLDALYDRFQMKFLVKPIHEAGNFKSMLKYTRPTCETTLSLEDIVAAKKQVAKVEISDAMIDLLLKIRGAVGSTDIQVTDRTYKTCEKLLKAEAWTNGRDSVDDQDFLFLQHVLWSNTKQIRKAASIVLDAVNPEQNKITRIFEMAEDLATKVLNEPKESKKRMQNGLEAATKLKDAKVKIQKYVETMGSKKKDTGLATGQLEKLDQYLQKIFSEVCGIAQNFF